jgi:hypothetical protein
MVFSGGGVEGQWGTYRGTSKSRWPAARRCPSTVTSIPFLCGYSVSRMPNAKRKEARPNLLPKLCNVPDCAEERWIRHALIAGGELDDLDDYGIKWHGCMYRGRRAICLRGVM